MPVLPISRALTEATPDSISDLFSRDPESFSSQDIDRIITEQRAHRERLRAAELSGAKTRSPRIKSSTVPFDDDGSPVTSLGF